MKETLTAVILSFSLLCQALLGKYAFPVNPSSGKTDASIPTYDNETAPTADTVSDIEADRTESDFEEVDDHMDPVTEGRNTERTTASVSDNYPAFTPDDNNTDSAFTFLETSALLGEILKNGASEIVSEISSNEQIRITENSDPAGIRADLLDGADESENPSEKIREKEWPENGNERSIIAAEREKSETETIISEISEYVEETTESSNTEDYSERNNDADASEVWNDTETESPAADNDIPEENIVDSSFSSGKYFRKASYDITARGAFGRLIIEDIHTDVAVFYSYDLCSLQWIVDCDDSACMFEWTDGSTIIADHVNQSFSGLRYSIPWCTVAELYRADEVQRYICDEIIYNGWNTGDDLTYYDGTPVHADLGEIILYTCNSDGTITITLWTILS